MQSFPHYYRAQAHGYPQGNVDLSSDEAEIISSLPPVEFGGPGGKWSPETLLVAAVADCFILTFRAIASASKFDWLELVCEAEGTLDRVDKVTKYTSIQLRAKLTVAGNTSEEMATRLLEKAEANCLITNSLSASTRLDIEVVTAV